MERIHAGGGEAGKREERAIEAVAKTLRAEIAAVEQDTDFYPNDPLTVDAIYDHIPPKNRAFLHAFLGRASKNGKGKLKLAALGQRMMALVKTRQYTSPLGLALATYVHGTMRSRTLIDVGHRLGLWETYDTVINYEKANAILSDQVVRDAVADAGKSREQMIQFMCDNADWNEGTLHGKEGWHVMAIMMAMTPYLDLKRAVPTTKVTDADILAAPGPEVQFSRVKARFTDETFPKEEDAAAATLIESSWVQSTAEQAVDLAYAVSRATSERLVVPLWANFQHAVQDATHPGPTRFVFHPFVEAKPDSDDAVYSTLSYVLKVSLDMGVTPVVTFDQPLYLRALKIRNRMAETDPRWSKIVIHLGIFHCMMSYMGGIGQRMEDSGIRKVLEEAYGSGAADHLLSGKAYSRGIRAHQIIHKALYDKLVEMLKDSSNNLLGDDEAASTKLLADLDKLDDLYDAMLATGSQATAATTEYAQAAARVRSRLADLKAKLRETSLTAKLWLGYLDQVDLLLLLLKSERTSNFEVSLSTMRQMLPHFAHSGRHHYLKSVTLYLQDMHSVRTKDPDTWKLLTSQYHNVRRTSAYFVAISTDMAIEQVFMANLKERAGLTRTNQPISDASFRKWALSRAVLAEVSEAVHALTGVSRSSGEQHVVTTKRGAARSRTKTDARDLAAVREYLDEHNPFDGRKTLQNLHTTREAPAGCDVHAAEAKGARCLLSAGSGMAGKKVAGWSYSRKTFCTVTQKVKKNKAGKARIFPELNALFQRFWIASQADPTVDASTLFEYELAAHPPSMFDDDGWPLKPNKPELVEALLESLQTQSLPYVRDDTLHVIDGGCLLWKVTGAFTAGITYEAIAGKYAEYVRARFGNRVAVVFDGYGGGSNTTKNLTQSMRKKDGVPGLRVANVRADVPFQGEKGKQRKFSAPVLPRALGVSCHVVTGVHGTHRWVRG